MDYGWTMYVVDFSRFRYSQAAVSLSHRSSQYLKWRTTESRDHICTAERERYSGGSRPSAKKGREEEEEQDEEEEEGGDEEDRLEKGKKGEGEGKW